MEPEMGFLYKSSLYPRLSCPRNVEFLSSQGLHLVSVSKLGGAGGSACPEPEVRDLDSVAIANTLHLSQRSGVLPETVIHRLILLVKVCK
jgi:hypothetical protein